MTNDFLYKCKKNSSHKLLRQPVRNVGCCWQAKEAGVDPKSVSEAEEVLKVEVGDTKQ